MQDRKHDRAVRGGVYRSVVTVERLKPYYSEREICEIVWLVATEHLYNVSNIGLNIGSDGLCDVRPPSRASGEEPLLRSEV